MKAEDKIKIALKLLKEASPEQVASLIGLDQIELEFAQLQKMQGQIEQLQYRIRGREFQNCHVYNGKFQKRKTK